MEVTNVCFVLVSCIALLTQVLLPALRGPIARVEPDLADWLRDHGLANHAGAFVDAGVRRLVDMLEVGSVQSLTVDQQERTTVAVFDLKNKLILKHYLESNGLENRLLRLEILGIRTLKEAVYMMEAFPIEFKEDPNDPLNSVLLQLPRNKKELESLTD